MLPHRATGLGSHLPGTALDDRRLPIFSWRSSSGIHRPNPYLRRVWRTLYLQRGRSGVSRGEGLHERTPPLPELPRRPSLQRGESSYGGGGGYGGQREMFSATCASCGKEAKVPFQPRGDKPVYCSDCFRSQQGSYGGGSRGSYDRGGGGRDYDRGNYNRGGRW